MNLAAEIVDILVNFPYVAVKYRDVPALLLLPATAVLLPLQARRLAALSRWLPSIALVVACSVIPVMLVSSASYLVGTGYLDHVEASIAAVSWWYHTGHPMYPDWNADQGVYGFQYGPLLFQITAAALMAGPSILVSKLPGFGCFWLACIVLMASLRPMLPSVRATLLPAAMLILVAGGYWRAAYWVRGEPYLLLFAVLGFYAWRRLDRVPAAIVIGLLGGGLVNLKVHAALYVLPYAVALLAAEGSLRGRVKLAVIGIAAGILAVVLPFLDPNVSLSGYIGFIQLALHHGIARPLLLLNLRFSAVLMLPVLFLVWRHLRGPDLVMGLVYCLCVAVVCLIGAKRGAGPTHLLPFLPAFVFFILRAAQAVRFPSIDKPEARPLAIYFLVMAIAYLPSFGSNLYNLRAWVRTTDNPAFRQEATRLYTEYPLAVMGGGDDTNYNRTEYKAIGVFAGGPLVFDTSTWMDMQGAGVPDEVLTRLLTGCRTRFWIIPNGGPPFSQSAAYSPEPLFSDRFRELFLHGYSPVRQGEYYSVWACRDVRSDR